MLPPTTAKEREWINLLSNLEFELSDPFSGESDFTLIAKPERHPHTNAEVIIYMRKDLASLVFDINDEASGVMLENQDHEYSLHHFAKAKRKECREKIRQAMPSLDDVGAKPGIIREFIQSIQKKS